MRVVFLDFFIVLAALDHDSVFGAGQLVLQSKKVFVGLQIGIIFDHHQEAADSAIELRVGVNLLLRRLRI